MVCRKTLSFLMILGHFWYINACKFVIESFWCFCSMCSALFWWLIGSLQQKLGWIQYQVWGKYLLDIIWISLKGKRRVAKRSHLTYLIKANAEMQCKMLDAVIVDKHDQESVYDLISIFDYLARVKVQLLSIDMSSLAWVVLHSVFGHLECMI